MKKKTIAIYGGTFSPPHIGHISACRAFLEAEAPDELLIIPALIPPHKDAASVGPVERLQMCRLAFSELPRTRISDCEVRRGGKSYTVLTLKELAAPDRRLILLCGTDMFLTLDSWYQAKELFSMAEIVGIRRENNPAPLEEMEEKQKLYEREYKAITRLLSAPVVEVSSAEIRKKIMAGEDASPWLDPKVEEYIRKWHLYNT